MLNFGFLYFSRASQCFKEAEKALLQPAWPSGNNLVLVFQSRQSVRLPVSWKEISLEHSKRSRGVRGLTAVMIRSCSGLGRGKGMSKQAKCYQ